MPDSHLVFISHSSRDTWVAKQIAHGIEECGAKAFLDEADIHLGIDFEDKILAALDKSHELVVLLTPWALDRPYIWAEIGVAWGRRLPIVTFLYGIEYEELHANPKVPIFLKKRNLLELNQIQTYFDELTARISHHRLKAGASDV